MYGNKIVGEAFTEDEHNITMETKHDNEIKIINKRKPLSQDWATAAVQKKNNINATMYLHKG